MIREEIINLAREGLPPKQIAAETGLAVTRISTVLHRARCNGEDVPTYNHNVQPHRMLIGINDALAKRLKAVSQARGNDPRVLARAIIDIVISEDLIDAVLADENPEERGKL